jgi:pimeloyl-ACP methyl ester carboxylesterase
MPASLSAVCALALALPPVETAFVQVAPAYREAAACQRSPGQARAIVLIHGLLPHPFSRDSVARPLFHEWQKPGSLLVKRLGQGSDVFAFAYGQNVPAGEVAESLALSEDVRRLQALGYREIVLVGHSAGGVIAREFVEDNPGSAVTKVIQVCAPNGGSGWASMHAVRANQIDFLASLTKSTRRRTLSARAGKTIPAHVDFACVVGTGTVVGDGLVRASCQWTEELQRQGIPAYPLGTSHWSAVRGKKGAELLAELARAPQPRWDARQVAAARRRMPWN